MHEFEFDKIFIDGGFMTLQSTAVYCCGHRLCIVLYIFHCSLRLFDIVVFRQYFNGQWQLYLLQSSFFLEFAETISHIERGCGYSAG